MMHNTSRLLIINNDKQECETLKDLLLPNHYELIFATDSKEGLKRATELMPDLILLDVINSAQYSFDICQQLRSEPQLSEIPLLMFISLEDDSTRLQGLKAGVDDFLSKPIDKLELLPRLRTITRLKRYRHLVVERSRFEWAVEQSNDGYLLLNDGNVIQYANSCARFYLGLLKESSLKDGFLQHIDKQNYRREPELAWENWPDSNVGAMPRYLVRSETNQMPLLWLQVELLESPADNSGCQVVRLRDVSEQMNLQQQMWTFQTLVSHKLRAPLNGLVGLQFLDERNVNLASERASSLLKIARESAKRLQVQILDILRYVDSSQLLQLNSTFKLAELQPLLNNIQGDLKIDTGTPYIDPSLTNELVAFSSQAMELVLRELLTNAKKFHPQQNPIMEISIIPAPNIEAILLCVSDNGRHLPSQELAKVWTPYYQSEKYFTGEVKGMGLGLAMIARLVWSSCGSCRLYNRENQSGITVELTLPLVSSTSPARNC
jgi:two-component system cell cycle response regulator